MFITLFLVFVVLMLALDLFVVHKKDREVTIGEAALWTGIWIGLALLFALLLYFFPGMELNSYGIPAVISHLKDKKVDFYLSMKLTGDISCDDPENYPAFRIDRIFVVDKD